MKLAQWKDFLVTEGAAFRDQMVAHFGNPEQEYAIVSKKNIITDLSHTGVIRVEGTDALAFLQGQMTCDIHEVGHDVSRLGAWCNAKGRVRITFRVYQWHEGFYLELPAECVADTLQQLQKYVFRSKLTIRDATGERVHIGCAGPNIAAVLQQIFPIIPTIADQIIHDDATTIMRLRGSVPRFTILGTTTKLISLWQILKSEAVKIGVDAWSKLEILTGVPAITRATTEAFVPHMLNLPELGAVSFRKGCYSGQEVVARTQYLGKTKRRLYLAQIPYGVAKPGDMLWAPQTEAELPAGQVVNCANAPVGASVLLAVIAVADVQRGTIRLHGSTGPLLDFCPLPYPLTEELPT